MIFAFPEEWKTTDDANSGMFKYSVKILGVDLGEGKIMPREKSAKELAAEEEANTKGKKARKQ